jgi:DNA helicase-2/ATP-dependent DNA helicase PcrA
VPRRGVGDATLEALARHQDETGEALPSALVHASEIPGAARAARALAEFAALLERLRLEAEGAQDADGHPQPSPVPLSVAEIIRRLLDGSGMDAELRGEDTIEARTRLENLEELLAVAEQRADETGPGLTGVREFLQQATLVAEADNVPGEEGQAVVCLTLHAAKGLEFPVVFLVGLEDGSFPHARSLDHPEDLEEERRLCYVGLTRARRRLYLTLARERVQYGGGGHATVPSRFLREIGMERLHEVRAFPAGQVRPRPRAAGMPAAPGPRVPAAESVMDLRVGERVVHPKWGEGVVVETHGLGHAGEVTVDFPDGTRTLILQYAKLRRA